MCDYDKDKNAIHSLNVSMLFQHRGRWASIEPIFCHVFWGSIEDPSKHDTKIQFCFNVGPPSATVAL